MAEWKFNRGEWTEAYVFMRLLGDGRIYGASENLVKDDTTYMDIVNIIRDEPNQMLIFERFIEDNIAKIRSKRGKDVITVVTAPEISNEAQKLYESIKNLSSSRVIGIADAQKYLEKMGIDTPKANLSNDAKEKYGSKTDIIMTTGDSLDHSVSTVGFSIKSHIGSPATLFNCSQKSGFTYQIVGCDESAMHEINAKDRFLDIKDSISENFTLQYKGCRDTVFEANICIVDSQMDKILSEALLIQAGFCGSYNSSNVKDICNVVAEINPLGVRNARNFYSVKFKDFLFASFAGMTASTEWNGRRRLAGGYIDVSRDGELLYYRAMSDDVFGEYLFQHTFFDRPDRVWCKDLAVETAKAFINGETLDETKKNRIIYKNGQQGPQKPKKGNYGYIYEVEGKYFIDLNFQIRFR